MRIFQSILRTGAVLAFATTTALMAQGPRGLGGGPGFGFGGFGVPGLLNHTVTGAPFSANLTVQRQQTLAGGNQIQQQEQATVARDTQGRVRIDATVTRPSSSGNQTRTEITIYDPVAGSIYRLNPQNMTGVQMPVRQNTSGPGGPTHTPPTNENVQTTSLGTQTINGVSATGTQVTRTIPAGTIGNTQAIQIVRVTWVSTALQIPVEITITDPRSGNETMNLTNIVQSAPSASLFTVPSGYTITQGPARGDRGAFRRPN
jgi:hypothetical protein